MVFIPPNPKGFRFRRSVLFMPASNERALAKAPGLDCDTIIFDLEDAVGKDEHQTAIGNLARLVKNRNFGSKETVVRTGHPDSPQFSDDLAVAIECTADAVLLPKIEAVNTVNEVAAQLKSAGSTASLWAMIETPLGLINLSEIVKNCHAAENNRLQCLVVGPNDLARATGVSLSNDRAALKPWLMQIIAAARAFDLSVLDGVFNNFKDQEGFIMECKAGAQMGFDGKTLIHPSQIAPANSAFGPSEADIDRARKIVTAFSIEENRHKGVIQLEGEMIERLHFEQAELLLEIARQI